MSARPRACCRAECNKAPFMYEMKGALSASPHRMRRFSRHPPVARCQPVRRRQPLASIHRFPGIRWFPSIRQLPGIHRLPVTAARPHPPVSRHQLVAQPFRRRAPPARAGYPARTSGFPAILAFRGFPQMVPVSDGESISTPSASFPQESAGIHLRFFLRPHDVHRIPPVIRMSRRLSTALCTTTPQVIWYDSECASA